MKNIFFITMLAALLVSCSEDSEMKPIELNQEFTLKLGDTGVLSEPSIGILMESIEDSRCPEDVQCIWEGEAKVKFHLELASGSVLNDSLSTFNRNAITIDGLMLELVEVTPFPTTANGAEVKTVKLRLTQN